MIKKQINPIGLLLLLTATVVVLSWVLSAYGVSVTVPDTGEEITVQSLISAEGLRWWLRTVVPDFLSYPGLGPVVLLVLSFGLAARSGLFYALLQLVFGNRGIALGQHSRHISSVSSESHSTTAGPSAATDERDTSLLTPLSRRDRRALRTTWVVLGVYVLLLLLVSVPHNSLLRSVEGGLSGGPFLQGLPFLIALGIAIASLTFGFTASFYHSVADVAVGLMKPIPLLMAYLSLTFLCSVFFSFLSYSHLDVCGVYGLADVLSRLSAGGGDRAMVYAVCQDVLGRLMPVQVILPIVLLLWVELIYLLWGTKGLSGEE